MPKVGANITDVSTEYVLIEPGTYQLEVAEVDYQEKEDKAVGGEMDGQTIKRGTHIIKLKVVGDADGGETEHDGKPVYDYINIHNKDGELNEISLGNLKRYFNAALGEDGYDPDDADTDQLKGCRVLGDIYIDTYKKQGSTRENQNNKIDNRTVLPVNA